MSKRTKKITRSRIDSTNQPAPSLGDQLVNELRPIQKISSSLRAGDASPETLRHILEMTVEEMASARDDDGIIYGSLAVAARYAAEQLAKAHSLDANEELAAKHWLIGRMGEQIHDFDLDEFRAWNAQRANRVRSIDSDVS